MLSRYPRRRRRRFEEEEEDEAERERLSSALLLLLLLLLLLRILKRETVTTFRYPKSDWAPSPGATKSTDLTNPTAKQI